MIRADVAGYRPCRNSPRYMERPICRIRKAARETNEEWKRRAARTAGAIGELYLKRNAHLPGGEYVGRRDPDGADHPLHWGAIWGDEAPEECLIVFGYYAGK